MCTTKRCVVSILWCCINFLVVQLNRDDKFTVYHPSPRLGSVDYGTSRMAVGIQNLEQISSRPLKTNLAEISRLRKTHPHNVVGVSIMGFCDDDWTYLARAAADAGAQILELNFSCPQMARSDGGHRVGQSFDLIERYTAAAKNGAPSIPIIAKMTPNLTDMLPAALAAQQGGADGVSAINTIRSVSHVDVNNQQPLPTVQGHSSISGFSGPAGRPIALRFITELASDPRLKIPISGQGGITTWHDAAEFLLLGASNLQVTTSVMHHGVRIVEDLTDGLRRHMRHHNMTSLARDMVGKSLRSMVDPAKLNVTTEAVSYINPDACIGCGQCEVACRDGAVHAISMAQSAAHPHKVAHVDDKKCVGCLLCKHVCPVEGAVQITVRDRIQRPVE